jgi:hypothetical protein
VDDRAIREGGEMVIMADLSERAKIGKILILASLVIGAVTVIAVTTVLFLLPLFRNVSIFIFIILGGLVIIKMIGLLFGLLAYFAIQNRDFNTAGTYALIGCALPPLDIVMAAGAIFSLISIEATGRTG